MKKTFTLLAAVMLTAVISAQAPDRMSYQAVIRNTDDQLLTNTNIGIQISILKGAIDGDAVYAERHFPTTNENGLVTIEIGTGVIITGTLSDIDWSSGIYFIKSQTDPKGGANYTITGISQLLSVPYALHARTTDQPGPQGETGPPGADGKDGIDGADGSDGLSAYKVWLGLGNTGTEAEFIASLTGPAGPTGPAGADGQDGAATVAELSDVDLTGITTGKVLKYNAGEEMWVIADDLGITSETDPVFGSSPAAGIDEEDVTNWNEAHSWGDHSVEDYLTEYTETDPSVPTGTQTGEMQYWDGSEWITVAAGHEGQVLTFTGGVPTWATTVGVGDVENPSTGKTWMDRNLGALRVAGSSTDADAYGDLYQWGRAGDGHQLRTSGEYSTRSSSNTPGHGFFIIESTDWRSPQNENLWQGVNGTNNPCPDGYRLPTEAEWNAERLSWSNNNAAGAFASPLKLPMAGLRNYNGSSPYNVGSNGYYWSSTVSGASSMSLLFVTSNALMSTSYRARGLSVRCIKD